MIIVQHIKQVEVNGVMETHLRCAKHSEKAKEDVYFPRDSFYRCSGLILRLGRAYNCKECQRSYEQIRRAFANKMDRLKIENGDVSTKRRNPLIQGGPMYDKLMDIFNNSPKSKKK